MDIVVTIPKARQDEIEAEEADVARREAAGELDISYYWEMTRLPKEEPARVYFVWDRAIRAYHHVTYMDREHGRIYMTTKINMIDQPIEMKGFQGFRYMKERP